MAAFGILTPAAMAGSNRLQTARSGLRKEWVRSKETGEIELHSEDSAGESLRSGNAKQKTRTLS